IVQEKNIKSFQELYLFSEKARIPTHIFYGKYKGSAIADLDMHALTFLARKSEDQYLLKAIDYELFQRSNSDFTNDLPW
ncbi:3'-5' exonuclease, partial [Acinetobacter baumannii]|nr:3'-5' exonuclease [Acinetobacter baumannii]